MEVRTVDLAEIFDVTKKTIAEWHKRGMPRVKRGTWNVKQVFHWYLANIDRGADTEDLSDAKLAYWRAKSQNEQIKADIARKRTIQVEDIVKAWTWRVAEVARGLEAIPRRIAPLIEHRPETEIASILEAEIWRIRDAFSRVGKFTPTADWESSEKNVVLASELVPGGHTNKPRPENDIPN